MLENLTIDDFRPLIGNSFHLNLVGHADTLTLIEATASRTKAPPGARASFSLIFRGEHRTVMLGQGQYSLDIPPFGPLDLFMVPIGPDDDKYFRYEILFG